MQVVIIGAGRGSRLMPTTADTPKCFAEVQGQRILDWTLDAFRQNGVDRFCFIGGYQIDRVRESNPEFTFRENRDWPNNNILLSLMHAEDLMDEPFLCCYSDILFTPQVVRDLLDDAAEISLGVDTEWLLRYEHRSDHPSDDAEKVTVDERKVICIHRDIPEAEAHGEYIGVAKFSAAGANSFRNHFRQRREQFAGQPYREAKVFEKAYLIHMLQDMIESGQHMAPVSTPGGYIEIDTQQDYEYASTHWKDRHLGK